MGFYIEKDLNGEWLPTKGKHDALIKSGAKPANGSVWVPGLICVFRNVQFDAACWVYSKREFKRVQPRPDDTRRRDWCIVDPEALRPQFPESYDLIIEQRNEEDGQ